jgi:hypothetical protein
LNPDGNERLTALVGLLLLAPIALELASVVLGVHTCMSLHVFVGLALIAPILLKLASTGWRFTRYYSGTGAYRAHGPPQIAMRLLAPLLVTATVVLFASGVAMGVLHGHALALARRLHGPASVVWLVLVGVHVLVYLKRTLIKSSEDVARATRTAVPGARRRAYVLAAAIVAGLVVAAVTVPAQHRWVDLNRTSLVITPHRLPRRSSHASFSWPVLTERRGEQEVTLDDRLGYVDELPSVGLGVVAKQVERPVRGDPVPGHQDALRLFDRRAPAEGTLQILVLREALQRDVDRALELLG